MYSVYSVHTSMYMYIDPLTVHTDVRACTVLYGVRNVAGLTGFGLSSFFPTGTQSRGAGKTKEKVGF